ncbi:MAG: nucleotide pyrophosphohydrolase [Promethearchaeota archaeon]|nr:MAG: nucleotide pyrophosphohydrolase [Candidatus Lokiarchaeota archaeon]
MGRSLDEIQRSVDEWIQKNSGYWSPLGMLAAVMEELGELSRELMHLTSTKIKKTDEPTKSLESELGDLFYAVICIANSYNISLDKAISLSMEKYQTRDVNRFTKKKEKKD